jgi:hypothetical protein
MNKTLENFARKQLKENLFLLEFYNPKSVFVFKRMYSHNNLDASINAIVDTMLPDNLDWAMTQTENTLKEYNTAYEKN